MFKILIFILLATKIVLATDPYPRNTNIDIQKYVFQLEVNDSTDVLAGVASVTVRFKKSISEFELDLIGKNNLGFGMTVSSVVMANIPVPFVHKNNRLKISVPQPVGADSELTFVVFYSGIPEDGLIIGKNKYGDRGFFGDNWPDRGRHWLPTLDHPSDKSAVDFIVIAPHHYQVVANGIQVEESFVDEKRKLTHWREEVPIPVKVMVVGIARFAVQQSGVVDNIPVESWVYPQNRAEGFYDYAAAVKVLEYFHQNIGPYSFKKLANVQSKTRWGGLENASAIFYAEKTVNGKGDHESLIAHEEAHQWFGNSATENDWHHVWLSEGFATYFTSLYLEHAYGRARLVEQQQKTRDQVIAYFKKNKAPIIDTTITDINKVLSTNTYQKAGWVLHMLRYQLGDELFWKGIRAYYKQYKGSNAMTTDFQKTMERESGKKLGLFFDQWLYMDGHPELLVKWSYSAKARQLTLEVNQTQFGMFFRFPLEVELIGKNDQKQLKTLQIDSSVQKFQLFTDFEPVGIVLDPNTWLLFEGKIQKK
ncbi:MAG: M1 family metallopeptidase [Cytophagales bacterium]